MSKDHKDYDFILKLLLVGDSGEYIIHYQLLAFRSEYRVFQKSLCKGSGLLLGL